MTKRRGHPSPQRGQQTGVTRPLTHALAVTLAAIRRHDGVTGRDLAIALDIDHDDLALNRLAQYLRRLRRIGAVVTTGVPGGFVYRSSPAWAGRRR